MKRWYLYEKYSEKNINFIHTQSDEVTLLQTHHCLSHVDRVAQNQLQNMTTNFVMVLNIAIISYPLKTRFSYAIQTNESSNADSSKCTM